MILRRREWAAYKRAWIGGQLGQLPPRSICKSTGQQWVTGRRSTCPTPFNRLRGAVPRGFETTWVGHYGHGFRFPHKNYFVLSHSLSSPYRRFMESIFWGVVYRVTEEQKNENGGIQLLLALHFMRISKANTWTNSIFRVNLHPVWFWLLKV